MRTYAIGDVHGCIGPLLDLLARIDDDAGGRPYRLVLLGDLIDRGPDSAGVVGRVRTLQAERPGRVVALKGNHEDLMLRAVRDPERVGTWLANGGDATLRSFGVDEIGALDPDMVDWTEQCPTWVEDDLHYFVHAGIDPDRPLSRQRDRDRMWIRDPFLESTRDFGRFVIHGHTPCRNGRPELRPNRINLDTACVYGGRLTAALFLDAERGPAALISCPSGT